MVLALVLLVTACTASASVPTFPVFDDKDLIPTVPASTSTTARADEPSAPIAEWPSFEMTFSVGPGKVGRLLFVTRVFYRADRVDVTDDAVVHRYSYQRFNSNEWTGNGQFENERNNGEVPWSLLTTPRTPLAVWAALSDGDPAGQPTTHELAGFAYSDGTTELETTAEGIPVRIVRDGIVVFEVTALMFRSMVRGEITRSGNQLSFDWASHVLPATTLEQRNMIADGIVTRSEYDLAAAATVSCAESAGGSATATYNESTGTIDLVGDPSLLEPCMATYLADVAEIWMLQSSTDQDEAAYRYAVITGNTSLQAILQAEPGEKSIVAQGDGWAIRAWERGPGICVQETIRNPDGTGSEGEGCMLKTEWDAPGIGTISPSWREEAGRLVPGSGSVIGITDGTVTAVEITFTSGTVLTYTTTSAGGDLGGYSGTFDPTVDGVPLTVSFLGTSGKALAEVRWLEQVCSRDWVSGALETFCGD